MSKMPSVFDYVTSKGTDILPGEKAIDALRRQLTTENNGRTLLPVERAKTVVVRRFALDEVYAGNGPHLRAVEPARDVEHMEDPIMGVVIQEDLTYRLIDGYHRRKFLLESADPRARHWYIVLR